MHCTLLLQRHHGRLTRIITPIDGGEQVVYGLPAFFVVSRGSNDTRVTRANFCVGLMRHCLVIENTLSCLEAGLCCEQFAKGCSHLVADNFVVRDEGLFEYRLVGLAPRPIAHVATVARCIDAADCGSGLVALSLY